MALNGPVPKVLKALIDADEITGSGVLFWSAKKRWLKHITRAKRTIWGD
jgi:hypothetical protein